MIRTTAAALLFATSAAAEAPRVVTDIAPIHSLVAQVMEGVGSPDLTLPPGASPHGYSMRPSEATALEEANVVIWVGEGLTPWLERPLESLAGSATHLELLEVEGFETLPLREGVVFEDEDHHDEDHHDDEHEDEHHDDEHGHDEEEHAEDHDGEEEHHEDEHGHHHGEFDPHAWLDPSIAQFWLDAIADVLTEADPDNAEAYLANAANAKLELEALKQDLSAALADHKERPFIVFHDGYQYFDHAFDLHIVGAISRGDAAAPGAARIAGLRALIAEEGIACIFSEPQYSDDIIATVTEGQAVTVSTLDPLGAEIELGPGLYSELLRRMGDSFASCLAG